MEPGQQVKYIAGLFPELANETYTIIGITPHNGIFSPDIEVFGNTSWNIIRKSHIDFQLCEDNT